jgi:hypothetical protein
MKGIQTQKKISQSVLSSKTLGTKLISDESLSIVTDLRQALHQFHLLQEDSLELTSAVIEQVKGYQPSLQRCLDSYEMVMEENRQLREENLECKGQTSLLSCLIISSNLKSSYEQGG